MNYNRHTLRALFAAALLMASQLVCAGKVSIEGGHGNTVGILLAEDEYQRAGLQNALQEPRFRTFTSNEGHMQALRDHVRRSTVARLEYDYQQNGRTHRRIYHARSGRSIQGTVDHIVKQSEGDTGSGSGSGSSESGTREWADDIDRDAAESEYYPRTASNEIRVVQKQGSQLRPHSARYGRDAELKALRHMEVELARQEIPPGGNLKAYVSQPPCASCEEAIQKFADRYRVNADVVHLTNAKPGQAQNASQKASREFFNERRGRITATLKTGAVTRAGAPLQDAEGVLERMEAAEGGRLGSVEPSCAP